MSDEYEFEEPPPRVVVPKEDEIVALQDMLLSLGWQLYARHIYERWGSAAFEVALNSALEKADVEDRGNITDRMRDSFKAVRADARWPKKRISTLKGTDTSNRHPSIMDRVRAATVGERP